MKRRRRDEALHDASEHGHEAIVSRLLRAGAVVDARDVDERTPLHLACMNGHASVVNLLMEGGADINAHDKQVRTPLHLASMGGHAAVVTLLVEGGAIPNYADDVMHSLPLHLASLNGHAAAVTALLAAEESETWNDLQDFLGNTPLHLACKADVVSLLLEGGAEIDGAVWQGDARHCTWPAWR